MVHPIRRPRCILVDDDPAWLLLIKTIAGGENLTFCTNSRFALDQVIKERPDILITDTNMPHTSGLELVKQVRQRPDLDNMAIIVLSSKHDDEMIEALYEAGATAVMSKDDFLAHYYHVIGEPTKKS